jgi:hypothetical protein
MVFCRLLSPPMRSMTGSRPLGYRVMLVILFFLLGLRVFGFNQS